MPWGGGGLEGKAVRKASLESSCQGLSPSAAPSEWKSEEEEWRRAWDSAEALLVC